MPLDNAKYGPFTSSSIRDIFPENNQEIRALGSIWLGLKRGLLPELMVADSAKSELWCSENHLGLQITKVFTKVLQTFVLSAFHKVINISEQHKRRSRYPRYLSTPDTPLHWNFSTVAGVWLPVGGGVGSFSGNIICSWWGLRVPEAKGFYATVYVCLNGRPHPMTLWLIKEQQRVMKWSLCSRARMRNSCSLRTRGGACCYPTTTPIYPDSSKHTNQNLEGAVARWAVQRAAICLVVLGHVRRWGMAKECHSSGPNPYSLLSAFTPLVTSNAAAVLPRHCCQLTRVVAWSLS